MQTLKDKRIFITGASRGIGEAIALRAAKEGACITIAAKSVENNPKLPGTIFSVAKEIEKLGGKAFPVQLDVRDDQNIIDAMQKSAEHFGGIDILINNASAISLTPTVETPSKRFDLMFSVNVRATFLCSQHAIPFLKQGNNPHILNLSPPLTMQAKWFKDHVAYTMSKYGMSMCTLGMSAELAKDGIAVNSLWPKTSIATAAIAVHFPPAILQASRKVEIVADAAHAILTRNSRDCTGHFFIDEDVLRSEGVSDFNQYALNPGTPLFTDLYVETSS